jgi:hypothetical protein
MPSGRNNGKYVFSLNLKGILQIRIQEDQGNADSILVEHWAGSG